MYVILVNDDNSLYGSKKQRIMQRSKLIDDLIFVVNHLYNGIDMTNATVMLEYLLPVSKKYKTEILSLSDERYEGCFLQYKLPIDTEITSEAGSIELQLTFAYVEKNENGNKTQRVRKTSTTSIEITPISAWSDIIPDSVLGGLDQRLVIMNSQIQAIDDYMNALNNNQVDNLVYNENDETLQLTSKGIGIGDKVSVRDMLDDGTPVVDLDGNGSGSNGDVDIDHDDGCDCGCEGDHEVVTF